MPDNNAEYYFLFLAFLAFAVLISMRLRDSRGRAWQAIREDELAAQAMGINVFVAKLQAFAIGASFAGVAGCLLASRQHSVFPANFMFTESINILAMVILGGMGNLFGVILGAALIVALPELFREFEYSYSLPSASMLMVLMVFRPQGLLTRGRRQAVPEEVLEPVAGWRPRHRPRVSRRPRAGRRIGRQASDLLPDLIEDKRRGFVNPSLLSQAAEHVGRAARTRRGPPAAQGRSCIMEPVNLAARDVRSVVHPFTDLARHVEEGPLVRQLR